MREPVRARASRWLLSPSTWKVPVVGAMNPARMLSKVVLPEPFGPSKPRIVPVGRVKLTRSRAVTLPNRMVSPWVITAGVSCLADSINYLTLSLRG